MEDGHQFINHHQSVIWISDLLKDGLFSGTPAIPTSRGAAGQPGDWTCPKCKSTNFARNPVCGRWGVGDGAGSSPMFTRSPWCFFLGNPTGNTLIFTGKKGPTGWFLQLLLEKHRERSHSQQYSCSEQHDKVQVVRCWNSNEVDRPQLPLPCHILWSTDIYGQRLCSCNWQCFSMTSWHMLTFYVYQAG